MNQRGIFFPTLQDGMIFAGEIQHLPFFRVLSEDDDLFLISKKKNNSAEKPGSGCCGTVNNREE
jgi:hypothetical protein